MAIHGGVVMLRRLLACLIGMTLFGPALGAPARAEHMPPQAHGSVAVAADTLRLAAPFAVSMGPCSGG